MVHAFGPYILLGLVCTLGFSIYKIFLPIDFNLICFSQNFNDGSIGSIGSIN